MIQVVDIVLLAIDALITALRQTYVMTLLKCLAYPFVALNDTLHNVHEAFAIDYLTWGSQVWLLEQMLNQKFNPEFPTVTHYITIGEGNRPDQPYLFHEADNRPFYSYPLNGSNHCFYLLTEADYGINGYDFIVNIPTVLGLAIDDPRIIQMLRRYKLAAKQYKIVLT